MPIPAAAAWGSHPIVRRLAAIDPNDKKARYRLAAAQFMSGAYADAIDTLGPLLDGRCRSRFSRSRRGLPGRPSGNTPRAVAALRQAIVLAPADGRFYVDFASA